MTKIELSLKNLWDIMKFANMISRSPRRKGEGQKEYLKKYRPKTP